MSLAPDAKKLRLRPDKNTKEEEGSGDGTDEEEGSGDDEMYNGSGSGDVLSSLAQDCVERCFPEQEGCLQLGKYAKNVTCINEEALASGTCVDVCPRPLKMTRSCEVQDQGLF